MNRASSALRVAYLIGFGGIAWSLLFPQLGVLESRSPDPVRDLRIIQVCLGLAIIAIMVDHILGWRGREKARIHGHALDWLQPYRSRRSAVLFLILALESDDPETSEAAHRELIRLTNQDLPPDPSEWRRWLRSESDSE